MWNPEINKNEILEKNDFEEQLDKIRNKTKEWLNILKGDLELNKKQIDTSFIPPQNDEESAIALNDYIQAESETPEWYTPPSPVPLDANWNPIKE
jgi:hypothetical protein